MDFFQKQERPVLFKKIDEGDGWGNTITHETLVSGLASIGSYSQTAEKGDLVDAASVRVFLKLSDLDKVADVKVGDRLSVDEVEYTVTKTDTRGVLPGRYKLRFEGTRK